MQRYNGVIESTRAKKFYSEIGDKWIFSTHFRISGAGFTILETSKCFHFTVRRS